MVAPEPTGAELRGRLEALACECGVDAFGVAAVESLRDMPTGLAAGSAFFERYRTAVVLGARHGALGPHASGAEVSLLLERAALAVSEEFESLRRACLIVHTEDEFDPTRRYGLLPLKALAKEAGLGWQGRSLLAVSPKLGPLHRLIAVLSDVAMPTDRPCSNRCGTCAACVDACPVGALSLVRFDDHPEHREDVLDVGACLGDNGCVVCIEACPWLRKE